MVPTHQTAPAPQWIQRFLLACGLLSSLHYLAMNIFIPLGFEGYSYADHTVSEVSAIGAPTRPLWVALGLVYLVLFAAFGWGVRQAAGENRRLRVVGGLIIAYGVIMLFWPPMHLRGAETTLTDTLHVVWAMLALLLMVLMMVFGAAALGKEFRLFTIASLALHVVFGTLTGLQGPNVAANLPTPMIGVWERINIAVFLLWIAVLAVVLLRWGRAARPQSNTQAQRIFYH